MPPITVQSEIDDFVKKHLTSLRFEGIMELCENCRWRHGFKCRRNNDKYIPYRGRDCTFACMDYKIIKGGLE